MSNLLAENKNRVTLLLAVGIIAITLVISAIIFANSNIYIKNLGSSLVQNGMLVNTVTVSGDGKVYAKPDMASLTVSVSELANTSQEALNNANTKINSVIEKLKSNSIAEEDIQTSQLNIYPEYDYTSGGSILRGQRASISLTVKVKSLDDKATKAAKVIDDVSTVSNVSISSINFDIENKTSLFTSARELAFNKAKQKAEELSKLSGTKLLAPVSISDATYDVSTPSPMLNYASDAVKSGAEGATSIQTGQLEVSINLNVVFGIE